MDPADYWIAALFALVGMFGIMNGAITKWCPKCRESTWWMNYPIYGKPSKDKSDAYWRVMETWAEAKIFGGIFALFLAVWILSGTF
jgi:hypothetical protein